MTTSHLPPSTANIAIFGGAFNPVTIAHQVICHYVYAYTGMPVWLMPCYSHLFAKLLESPVHRQKMLECAVNDFPYLSVSNWEIDNRHNGSMFETLSALSLEHPTIKFHLVIGMDNAYNIQKWHRGEELINTFPCIVVGRGGSEKPITDWYFHSPHQYLPLGIAMSATDIRAAVTRGDYEYAINRLKPAVWEYIVANKLYGYKGS